MSFGAGCKTVALTVLLSLGGAAMAQQVATQRPPDPARGEQLFEACQQCHAIESGAVKIGPSLAGVVGRRPGSVPAFGYSKDMIDFGASGAVWTPQNLDRFLTRPRSMIAGTKMVFHGFRKPLDRADLIAYLSTIRG